MDKLKMHTPNLTQKNIRKIMELFPNCVTEVKEPQIDTDAHRSSIENIGVHLCSSVVKKAIDFDLLRQELSESIVEGPQERYHLNWPGKREALLTANALIAKTLRPCREESVDFDTTKNLFIEGDNLEALKLLQETYLGKVKMIYIDPPYNTGNDFIYEDDFAENADEFLKRSNQKDEEGNRLVANTEANGRFHSDWLSMMYPRLKLARNLLSDNGLIFVSIDEGEHSSLRAICNEIFGEKNFIESVTWKKRYGAGGGTKGFAKIHDYVLVYSKSSIENIDAPLSEEQISAYSLRDGMFATRGGYVTQPLATSSKGERANLMYSIHHDGDEIRPKKGTRWIWSEEKFLEAYKNDQIVINKTGSGYSVRFKQYLKDENGVIRRGKPLSILTGVWNQDGTDEITSLFGNKGFFDFPKPSKLLRCFFSYMINNIDDKEAIILDFFAGSSTSADAVIQLNAEDGGNRKFIMVQLAEPCHEQSEAFKAGYQTIAEISKERIRRAGARIKAEGERLKAEKKAKEGTLFSNSENSSFSPHPSSLDIGFRVLKVDSSNMADVYYTPDAIEQGNLNLFTDNIKPDRKPEDLLFQVLLDWGVDLTLPISKKIVRVKKDEGGRLKDEEKQPEPSIHPSSFSLHPSKEYEVYFVDENSLIACFDTGVNEELVKELAGFEPLRVVFRDSGFVSDAVKINVEQIFKQMSPGTEVKSI